MRQVSEFILDTTRIAGRKTFFVHYDERSCRIAKRFAFTRDFESAFPPEMLATAVNKYAKDVAKSHLRVSVLDVGTLLQDAKPFAVAFKERYGFELSKPRFAVILGVLMSRDLEERGHWYDAFNKRPPAKPFRYEVYKFLKFIMS
jgi:hypothetical protein